MGACMSSANNPPQESVPASDNTRHGNPLTASSATQAAGGSQVDSTNLNTASNPISDDAPDRRPSDPKPKYHRLRIIIVGEKSIPTRRQRRRSNRKGKEEKDKPSIHVSFEDKDRWIHEGVQHLQIAQSPLANH